jgi:hypothetical protein
MDVMGTRVGSPVEARPREWLAMPGGRIRQVVSVPPEDSATEDTAEAGTAEAGTAEAGHAEAGTAELVSPAVWLARLAPTCPCGRPCLGSGRTCGAAECVRRLRAREAVS